MALGLLAGCADSPNEEKQFFIGALYDSLQVESRIRQRDELNRYAEELGVRLVFQDGGLSERTQLDQAENLITQGVDAIILLAHNPDAMGPLVEMCNSNDVLLVVIDRILPDLNFPYFVGWDNDFIGYEQANFALRNQPAGNYVLIAGSATDPNALEWKAIWDEVLAPHIASGAINIILDEHIPDWDPTIAANHTENALTIANDDVQVIMAMADILATGVIQVLEQRRLGGQVLVTGLDGEETAYQRIAEGTQAMTLQVNDDGMVHKTLDLIVAHLSGEDTSRLVMGTTNNGSYAIPTVFIDLILVDANNLIDMIKLGYVDFDVVFANVPEANRPPRP
jgi:D-xylose transport system substrate-binding protein